MSTFCRFLGEQARVHSIVLFLYNVKNVIQYALKPVFTHQGTPEVLFAATISYPDEVVMILCFITLLLKYRLSSPAQRSLDAGMIACLSRDVKILPSELASLSLSAVPSFI